MTVWLKGIGGWGGHIYVVTVQEKSRKKNKTKQNITTFSYACMTYARLITLEGILNVDKMLNKLNHQHSINNL